MSLQEFLKKNGIIECVNGKKETYYLDIEQHIIYTKEEINNIYKEANGNV